MILIVVPGPPRAFQKKIGSWQAKDGRFGTTARDTATYSNWRNVATLAVSRAMSGRNPLTCAVDLKVNAYFVIPESWSGKKKENARRGLIRPVCTPDHDNILKACGDSLLHIAVVDDKQIVHSELDKWYSDRPRVEMIVSETMLAGQTELRGLIDRIDRQGD